MSHVSCVEADLLVSSVAHEVHSSTEHVDIASLIEFEGNYCTYLPSKKLCQCSPWTINYFAWLNYCSKKISRKTCSLTFILGPELCSVMLALTYAACLSSCSQVLAELDRSRNIRELYANMLAELDSQVSERTRSWVQAELMHCHFAWLACTHLNVFQIFPGWAHGWNTNFLEKDMRKRTT